MSDVKAALQGATHHLVGIRKHQALFREGQAAKAVYRVESGCLRLQVNGQRGHREIVTFLFPGDLFFVGFQTHWASAYAVTEASIAAYDLDTFWRHIAGDPDAAMAVLVSADGRLGEVAHHLHLLSHYKAPLRLRWFLEWLASRTDTTGPNGEIHIPMSRSDIADFLGVAPETISRLFHRLEARGQLRRTEGHRCILRFERRDSTAMDFG